MNGYLFHATTIEHWKKMLGEGIVPKGYFLSKLEFDSRLRIPERLVSRDLPIIARFPVTEELSSGLTKYWGLQSHIQFETRHELPLDDVVDAFFILTPEANRDYDNSDGKKISQTEKHSPFSIHNSPQRYFIPTSFVTRNFGKDPKNPFYIHSTIDLVNRLNSNNYVFSDCGKAAFKNSFVFE